MCSSDLEGRLAYGTVADYQKLEHVVEILVGSVLPAATAPLVAPAGHGSWLKPAEQ